MNVKHKIDWQKWSNDDFYESVVEVIVWPFYERKIHAYNSLFKRGVVTSVVQKIEKEKCVTVKNWHT